MAGERWWADDWEITQGIVRDVETRDGLYRASGLRGGNVEIAARGGNLYRAKKIGPGGFVLNLWLGDKSRSDVDRYYDELLRATAAPHRMTRYRRLLEDGSQRECYGEVVQAIEPRHSGQALMRCGLEVGIPSGVWRDAPEFSGTRTDSRAGTGVLRLSSFVGSTAPLDDLVYRIPGPVDLPTVVDVTDGVDTEAMVWQGSVGLGQTLVINSGTWRITGEGGLIVPSVGPLSFTGDRFLTVAPARPGVIPSVRFQGVNVGVGAGLSVSGVRSFRA